MRFYSVQTGSGFRGYFFMSHKSKVGQVYDSARGRIFGLLPGYVKGQIRHIERNEFRKLSLLEMEGLWEQWKKEKDVSARLGVGTRV